MTLKMWFVCVRVCVHVYMSILLQTAEIISWHVALWYRAIMTLKVWFVCAHLVTNC